MRRVAACDRRARRGASARARAARRSRSPCKARRDGRAGHGHSRRSVPRHRGHSRAARRDDRVSARRSIRRRRVQSLDPVAVRTSRRHDGDRSSTPTIASPRGTSARSRSSSPTSSFATTALERRVPLVGAVFVRSVLPADTAQRVPKPPRALFEFSAVPMVAVGAHRGGDHRARSADLVVDRAAGESRRPRSSSIRTRARKREFERIEALASDRGGRARALRHADGRSAARLSRRALRGGGALADEHRAATRRARRSRSCRRIG